MPDEKKLSPGAIALWHYLLYRCNACALPSLDGRWLWRVAFWVRPKQLEQVLKCSERHIRRYRSELEASGRLKYQRAVKNRQVGFYTLIPFADNVAPVILENLSGEQVSVYGHVDKSG